MKKLVIIFSCCLLFYACKYKKEDFVVKEEGVKMQLLSFDETTAKKEETTYFAASIKIFDQEKLIYKRYKKERLKLTDNPLFFLTEHLNLGDSCWFKVKKSKLKKEFDALNFENENENFVDVFIKIEAFYDLSDNVNESLSYDAEMLEQILLKNYLKEFNAKETNGVYKEIINKGNTTKVEVNDEITILYKGYFINRLVFDNLSDETAFTFTYGTPDQLIKGLEGVLISMYEGEKSKIIIPSQLAFGEEGSTTLIVPPFTTVIYELEILKIKKNR
ncbi:MAG: FKBP-type peptidyl-prolyl cis-trans isomerase [Vicingaceae bacterium]